MRPPSEPPELEALDPEPDPGRLEPAHPARRRRRAVLAAVVGVPLLVGAAGGVAVRGAVLHTRPAGIAAGAGVGCGGDRAAFTERGALLRAALDTLDDARADASAGDPDGQQRALQYLTVYIQAAADLTRCR